MKKSIILFFALVLGVSAYAQQGGSRGMRQHREMVPEEMAARMTKELDKVVGLDSIQYQVVYLMYYSDMSAAADSMKARRARIEQMRASGKSMERQRPTEEQMKARQEVQKQRKAARDEQMKSILNDEQYQKYLKYEQEREQRRPQGGERGGRRGRPAQE